MKLRIVNEGNCPIIIQYVERGKDYSGEPVANSSEYLDIDDEVTLSRVDHIISVEPENSDEDIADFDGDDEADDDDSDDSGDSELSDDDDFN